jgi:A118 family predicted phage portal protein
MSFLDTLKGGIKKMLGISEIERVISVRPAISTEMRNAITQWSQMYEGRASWLREPTPDNPVRVVSLGLPALIASEKARLATLEMESEITPPMKDVEKPNPEYQPPGKDEFGNVTMGMGSMTITEPEPDGPVERANFLNVQYTKLKKQIRRQLEYGIAKGGLIIKPYVMIHDEGSTTIDERDDGERLSSQKELPKYEIAFDFIQADNFYPLSFDNSGRITEAAFVQTKIDGDKLYTRFEHHKLEGRSVTVKNYAFVKQNFDDTKSTMPLNSTDFGKPCSLSEVEEWSNMAPSVTVNNVDRPLYAYFKMPEANTVDPYSPLGVSGYSRAVSLIRDADEQYSRMLWEFEGGELAIDVDRDALKIEEYRNGEHQSTLPTKQERLFRKVDLNSEETYEVFAPPLRDASIVNGLNLILSRIEDACGLSKGTLSEHSFQEMRTATEMKMLKQRSFSTNADIQSALEDALRDAVYVMDVYCTLYDIAPSGEYEISFEWDDSLIVDTESELEKRLTMVNAGISSKLETRMWYFGETENQAKAALQKVDDEKKQSMETNIVAQQQLGEFGQGKDFSGDNNNPTTDKKDPLKNKKASNNE